MGDEINSNHFSQHDFDVFSEQLAEETSMLKSWFDGDVFADEPQRVGFELEAWLIDRHGQPQPKNDEFLALVDDPFVVPELAKFNIEINGEPQWLTGDGLKLLHVNLDKTLSNCQNAAEQLQLDVAIIGILPTVNNSHLTLENISTMQRYFALNEQILNMRQNRPIELDIEGRDRLKHVRCDVMLESVTTSFQIHLQTSTQQSARLYNLSKVISGPMVAVSANSPYLFGHELWHETRIPVFEQSIDVGKTDYGTRVTFGKRYVEDSLFECFQANHQSYPVLLPAKSDQPQDTLPHLRFHNGTIWRWNRPLIGFSDSGQAHLRIEHRAVPAGPTVIDCVANAAFYYGLVNGFDVSLPVSELADFETAAMNFYAAARFGLSAEMQWAGQTVAVNELILTEFIPQAITGLRKLKINEEDISLYMGVIKERVRSQQNGAQWQINYIGKYGHNMQEMLMAYVKQQKTGQPVHLWEI
jgi:gamma-glutamyl:cysteine ligase YbdK (ATP-grasp superfamily)